MKISLTGRHMNIGDSLRQHAETRLSEAAAKYFQNPLEAHIVFDKQAHGFTADIQVHPKSGLVVQGHAEAGDAYASFDLAMEKLERRLRRYKNKLKDSHHGMTHEEMADYLEANQYVLAGDDHADTKEEAPDQPLVIAEMTTRIETMTVSEAVMRMDLSGYPVVLFRNDAHGGLNVIYRRPDGNIGWIDPPGNKSFIAAE